MSVTLRTTLAVLALALSACGGGSVEPVTQKGFGPSQLYDPARNPTGRVLQEGDTGIVMLGGSGPQQVWFEIGEAATYGVELEDEDLATLGHLEIADASGQTLAWADAAQRTASADLAPGRYVMRLAPAATAPAEGTALFLHFDADEAEAGGGAKAGTAKALEAERKAADEKRKAEAEAAAARAAAEKQAREAEETRRKAELAAAKEAACKSEQGRLEAITAKGSDGTGFDDLKTFAKTVTCDRLGGLVIAALDKFKAEAARRAAAMPNSPELVRSAQVELIRLGCLTGRVDGALNPPTGAALSRYMKIEGQPTDNVKVTEALVAELTKHATRVCPIECKAGETLKGETCIADEKSAPAVAATPKRDDYDAPSRRKQQAARPSERARPAADAPAPRAKQQAVARPSIVSGGGGRSNTLIGVGF